MPSGYLVSLGDGILNPSDPITGPLTDFTTADILGNGSWTWSGTWTGNGTNYSNITDTGIYYLGTDGNTYFIPTNWFVDPITTASVTTDPSIDGTAGNDVINDSYTDPDGKTLDATDNVIHTGAGNDTIITNGAVNGSADTVFAGSGNDTVITGRGDDVVYGEAGDDTIEGGSGADRLDGGDGVDTISGGSGNDTILGGADNDILSGNGGSDIVDGGTGDDVIDGGAGNDTLRGDEGADTITGGVGEDEIYGGEGGDTIYGAETAAGVVSTKMSWAQEGINGQDITGGFTQDADGINITVGAVDLGGLNRAEISTDPQYVGSGPFATNSALQFGGAGNGGSGIVQTARIEFSFEASLDSGLQDDVQNLQFRVNDIDQGSWRDYVTVRAFVDNVATTVTFQLDGDETMFDADTINGDEGNDVIYGDRINFDPADFPSVVGGAATSFTLDNTAPVDVQLGWVDSTGTIQLYEVVPSGTSTTRATFEGDNWVVLDANTGAVLEYLGEPADGSTIAFDSQGNDILNGGIGDDTIYGEYGNDTIDGGDGIDTIFAGEGDDIVTAGLGDDTVYLGAGNDTFGDWSTDDGNDIIYGEDGNDTINGGAGNDEIYGGDGDDTLIGAAGNDIIEGGFGSDDILITDDHNTDVIEGGEDVDGTDFDTVVFSNFASTDGVDVTFTGEEAGDCAYTSTVAEGDFIEIEQVGTTSGDDTVDASITTQGVNVFTNDGADDVTGGSGDDVIALGSGTDTVDAGVGNDAIDLGDDGAGNPDGDVDLVMFSDGDGNDTIANFDAPTADGDGSCTGIDGVDVSDLRDADGELVNTRDVSVSTNGDGDAVWTFPNGETLTFIGLTEADVGSPAQMVAMGVPADGIVSGDATDNTIDATYLGDPDGDMVDNNDALIAGEVGDDDIIEAGGGSDTVIAGEGNDEIYGDLGSTTGSDPVYAATSGTSGTLTGTNGQADTTYSVTSGTGSVNTASSGTITNGYRVANNGDGGAANETYTHAFGQEVAGAQIDFTVLGLNEELQITLDGVTLDLNDAIASGLVSFEGAGSYVINAGGNVDFIDGQSNSVVGTLTINQPFTTMDVTGISSNGSNITGIVYSVEIDSNPPVSQGNDDIDGGAGNDEIYGHGGDDTLRGGADDDTIYGGTGDDAIWGDGGDDTMFGGDGTDTFRFADAFGTDTVVGGETGENSAGDLIYGTSSQDFTVTMSGDEAGSMTNGSGTVTFEEIERVYTNGGNDTVDLTGDTSGMLVYTAEGDDVVTSGAGDDNIQTDDGDDTIVLNEGFGVDSIAAGSVDTTGDTLDASSMTSDVTVTFTDDEDGTLAEGANIATFDDIEIIATGSGDDTINATGDTVGVNVSTGAGEDTITGGTGDDIFDGGDGDDLFIMNAGFGNDDLIGGEGD